MRPAGSFLLRAPGASLALTVGLGAITWLVNRAELEAFWHAPHGGSFDGMSHLVVGAYYADHIFPRTWGWASDWFAGMPFPVFYPPLFYVSTALLSRVLSCTYEVAAKGLLCLLITALPGLSATMTWTHTRSAFAAFSAGGLTIAALANPGNPFGVSVTATLTRGLFTQLPGYVCLLVWAHLFLLTDRSPRARYLSMPALLLVLLSNVHVVPVVALFFVVALGLELVDAGRRRDVSLVRVALGRHAVLGLIPLLAASFWYVPLLASWDYFVTMALPAMRAADIALAWMVPCLLTAAALGTARRHRAMQTVALVCLGLVVGSVLDSARLFPSLPIQPFRVFAAFTVLSCVPMGYVLGRLIDWVTLPPLRGLAFVMLMSPFAWTVYAATLNRSESPVPAAPDAAGLRDFVRSLRRDDRLTNVELHASVGDPSYLTINRELAAAGLGSTYTALRESSISSLFMTPLRNGLSARQEAWGVDTFLAFDPDFLAQSLDRHLRRAEYMRVGRLITATPTWAESLSRDGRIVLEAVSGRWRAFTLTTGAGTAEVVDREPAVFFGPVTFKKRSTWSYDYARLQEEIFFRARFDVLVARAHDPILDISADLDRFATAIITEYRYRDLEGAYQRLKRYAEGKTLICVAADDPLFRRLATLAPSPHLHLFERLRGEVEDVHPLRRQFHSMLNLVARHARPVAAAAGRTVRDVHLADGTVRVRLAGPVSGKVPVLIRISYFPYWRRRDAEETVYMVTPTFMLTWADSELTLEFAADAFTRLGLAVSAVTVSIAGVALARAAGRRTR